MFSFRNTFLRLTRGKLLFWKNKAAELQAKLSAKEDDLSSAKQQLSAAERKIDICRSSCANGTVDSLLDGNIKAFARDASRNVDTRL